MNMNDVPPPVEKSPSRYFDKKFGMEAAKILPGEYFATDKNMLLVTVLGSCVAACVRDSRAGVGGMNHFMLPRSETGGACRGRMPLECHQAVLVALCLASFFWRSSALRAIRLNVPDRPIAFFTSRIVSPAIAR